MSLDLPGNPDDIGAHIPVNSPILEEKYKMVFLARSCVKFQVKKMLSGFVFKSIKSLDSTYSSTEKKVRHS